jgi:hypothetical protein
MYATIKFLELVFPSKSVIRNINIVAYHPPIILDRERLLSCQSGTTNESSKSKI